MTEPTVTATDVLRQIAKARNKSPHAISLIAREVDGIGAGTLEDFAAGKADLGAEVLKALTMVFYPNAEYDAELNLLRSLAPPAKPMGITSPPNGRAASRAQHSKRDRYNGRAGRADQE